MNKFRIAKAGINVNEGIKRMCGDVDMFEELLSRFPEDTHYQEMLKSVEAGDAKEAFAAAHALKGIAGNMSMTKLYDAICPAVEVLREGSVAVDEYLPALEEAYTKALNAINDMNNKSK